MLVKCSAVWRLYCLFVEIWNEHPVVRVNKGPVKCYLHVNNLLHGCIVYELSVWTKYRLPLMKSCLTASRREEGALLLHWNYWATCYDRKCASTAWCTGSPSQPRVTVLIVLTLREVSLKELPSFVLFSQKPLFQQSHTRLTRRSCVISHCTGEGRLLATF